MIYLAALAILFGFSVPAHAQTFHTPHTPVVEPVKTRYAYGEPFSFRYVGPPTPLTAELTDHDGKQLHFKAVLRDSDSESSLLVFESPDTSEPGMYRIKISSGLSILADTEFVREGIDYTPSPTPSVPPVPAGTLRRSAASVAAPGRKYETVIEYTAERDGPVTLTDIVPLNALIDAPEASPSVRPELLNLRMPFEKDYEVTLPFGQVDPDIHFGIAGHDGTDYALPSGVPIHAVDDGEIVPYREKNSYGITAAIQHSWGKSFYGHLSTMSAQLGTEVRKGDVVGLSGNTGLSSGPHLHFGIMIDDSMVDAARYIKKFNDSDAAAKQLSWPLYLSKGETAQIRYRYSLPVEYEFYDTLRFGPAALLDPDEHVIAQEKNISTVIISNDDTDMQKIIADPSYSGTSPLIVRDGVILWIDSHDDRILHGFDKVTQTTFAQKIDPEAENSLTIDSKHYIIRVRDGKIGIIDAPPGLATL